MATQTAIVHESVADRFLSLLTSKYPTASAKSPADGSALRGLFTQASAERVRDVVQDALGKGAEIIAGENRAEGNVMQPVLLKGVKDGMRVYREEMFAPVFSVLTYTTDEEAIKYANDHDCEFADPSSQCWRSGRLECSHPSHRRRSCCFRLYSARRPRLRVGAGDRLRSKLRLPTLSRQTLGLGRRVLIISPLHSLPDGPHQRVSQAPATCCKARISGCRVENLLD